MQSTNHPDHYKALGITKNASQDDIRKAYKKLAKEWHPDKNPNIKDRAEKKFKEISEAHRVLTDGQKRYEYDRQRDNAKRDFEMQEERRKRDNIRRMDREQKDYVRRQEEKRRKAQRMRAAYHDDMAPPFDETDNTFKHFFEGRDRWRTTVPDLFGSEQSHVRGMMNDIFKMSNTLGFDRGETTSNGRLTFDLRSMQSDVDALKKRQRRLEKQLNSFKSMAKEQSYLYDC